MTQPQIGYPEGIGAPEGLSSDLSALPGLLLATVEYGTATQTTYTATTSYTALDSAHLSISFTVPASGAYYIDVGIDWGIFTTDNFGGPVDLFLGIAPHGTTAPVGYPASIGGIAANYLETGNDVGIGGHGKMRFYVTGATPGATRLDLIMGVNSTSGATAQFYVQNGGTLTTDPTAPCLIQAFSA